MAKTKYLPASALMALAAAIMAKVMTPIERQMAMAGLPHYRGRGKGEGCVGNKHAKSSFKQNQRRGL